MPLTPFVRDKMTQVPLLTTSHSRQGSEILCAGASKALTGCSSFRDVELA